MDIAPSFLVWAIMLQLVHHQVVSPMAFCRFFTVSIILSELVLLSACLMVLAKVAESMSIYNSHNIGPSRVPC